jgi:hypothetical protein
MKLYNQFLLLFSLIFAITLIISCSGIKLGKRDVNYNGVRNGESTISWVMANKPEWYEAIGLLNINNTDKGWCSAVAIGVDKSAKLTYAVTAKHCTTRSITQITFYPMCGGFKRYNVLKVDKHPIKDFTLLTIDGIVDYTTSPYRLVVPDTKDDYVIGFEGGSPSRKTINKNWAIPGQSGGGVFSPETGLYAIVSTNTEGVNIYKALQDMKMDWILDL